MCHKRFESHASCEDGHYICDACHAKKGIQVIMEGCAKSTSRNPIAIRQELMMNPYIYMHGPEHHVMVGAALLTAYRNSGGKIELDAAASGDEGQGKRVSRRSLRPVGMLRSSGKHGDVHEYYYKGNAAYGTIMETVKSYDFQGA